MLLSSGIAAEFRFQGSDQMVAIDLKRILSGPQLLDDFEPRIVAVRLNRQEPAARREASHERGEHPFRFEFCRHAGTPRLRCQDQIVALEYLARFRNY